MSPRTRPPGRTFKERWPRDAAEASFFSKSSSALALGGVLGVLLVPLAIRDWFASTPLALAILLGSVMPAALAIPRVHGSGQDWLVRAWKSGAWVLAAGGLGLVIDLIMQAMCGASCGAALLDQGRRPPVSLLIYVPVVAGSMGIAWLVDRTGDALRRRAA